MLEKYKKVTNPLTIVAIFAGLAEISGTVALSLVSKELQVQFIWFVMLFPVFLVSVFFLTLNFNPRVLYSPADFSDEDNFMSLFKERAVRSLTEVEQALASDEKRINMELQSLREQAKQKGLSLPKTEIVASTTRGNVMGQLGSFLSAEEFEKLKKSDPYKRILRDRDSQKSDA